MIAITIYIVVGLVWILALQPLLRFKYDVFIGPKQEVLFHKYFGALIWPYYLLGLFIGAVIMGLVYIYQKHSILDKLNNKIDNFWHNRLNPEKKIDETKSSYRNISYMEGK